MKPKQSLLLSLKSIRCILKKMRSLQSKKTKKITIANMEDVLFIALISRRNKNVKTLAFRSSFVTSVVSA